MSERENNIYKAKLAEQAERYDGKLLWLSFFFVPLVNLPESMMSDRPKEVFFFLFLRTGKKNAGLASIGLDDRICNSS